MGSDAAGEITVVVGVTVVVIPAAGGVGDGGAAPVASAGGVVGGPSLRSKPARPGSDRISPAPSATPKTSIRASPSQRGSAKGRPGGCLSTGGAGVTAGAACVKVLAACPAVATGVALDAAAGDGQQRRVGLASRHAVARRWPASDRLAAPVVGGHIRSADKNECLGSRRDRTAGAWSPQRWIRLSRALASSLARSSRRHKGHKSGRLPGWHDHLDI